MRPFHVLALLALPVLSAACESPGASCDRIADRQLARHDALIAEAEATLARGYRVEEVARPVSFDAPCPQAEADASGRIPLCPRIDVRYEIRRIPIDPADWRARLDNLRDLRPGVARAAAADRAACADGRPASGDS